MSKNWTYEKLIEEARKLRAVADEAKARLHLFLHRVQTTPEMMEIIEAAGTDFHSFVENEIGERHSQYTRFVEGFDRIDGDEDLAIQMGFDAVCEATRIQEQRRMPDYVGAITAWVEEKGRRPTAQTARARALEVDPRRRVPQSTQRKTRMQQLKEENAELRARVRALEAENRALEKKIERFERKGMKKTDGSGGSRKTRSKQAKTKAA